MSSFYMIWNPRGHQPTVKHDTIDRAQQEAKRLAEKCPGHEFFILKAVSVAKRIEPVEIRDLESDEPFLRWAGGSFRRDEEYPF